VGWLNVSKYINNNEPESKRKKRLKEVPLPYCFPAQQDFLLWYFHLSVPICLPIDEPGSLTNGIPGRNRWLNIFLFLMVLAASPVHS